MLRSPILLDLDAAMHEVHNKTSEQLGDDRRYRRYHSDRGVYLKTFGRMEELD